MITLVLLSAALTAACYTAAHRSPRTRVRDISAMLGTGFIGVLAAAVTGLLFGPPSIWVFTLLFAFAVGLESRIIRQRRAEAARQRLLHVFPLGPRREGER